MWRLASYAIWRQFRTAKSSTRLEAWIAAGATTTVIATAWSGWNDEKNGTYLTSGAATETSCEPLAAHFSNLRRQKTIQKIERTATKVTLKERYRVEWKHPLGEGSFGSVYIAIDRKSGERVAVKKISKTLTDNVAFQREMDALLHLRQAGGHPNICGLRENFDEGDYYYFVLDLVAGGEMFDHLCSQGAYSEADAARLVREAASALAFCHGINIVHGDLKPENLMLSSAHSSDAVIKVVDFGCAQVTFGDMVGVLDAPTTHNQGAARTPAYSPPEIIEMIRMKEKRTSHRIGPSFDMWVRTLRAWQLLE